MAEAILGEHALACKTPSPSIAINAAALPQHWYELPGLLDDPLIEADDQVGVLGLIEKAGSATLDQLMAALPGHPSPAKAVLQFVRHGLLAIDEGIVTGSSILRRRNAPLPQTMASGGGNNGAPPQDPGKLRRLAPLRPQPEIFCVNWTDRALFRKEPMLAQRGVYLALYMSQAYSGASEEVVARLVASNHLLQFGFPDLVVAAVDRNNILSAAQVRVAERLLARAVQKDGQLKLCNRVLPAGDQVSLTEYSQTERFVRELVAVLRDARIAFHQPRGNTPAFGEPDPQLPIEGLAQHGPELVALQSCGVHATARVEGGQYVVLAGSQVRRDITPSAGSGVAQQRQELTHDGTIVPHGDNLLLTRDVAFDTASGAARFVVGSRHKPEIWRPLPQPENPGGLVH